MSTIAANPPSPGLADHPLADLEQIATVKIVRRKGRIAGFGHPSVPVHVLWCGSNRPRKKFGQRRNGWSFPPAVRELLLQKLAGRTAVHLFGGAADFGLRLDIDPATNPHVLGDAWNPPFPCDSFDAVILDPPYMAIRQAQKIQLMRAAAWIARDLVIWFHTVWIATDRTLPLREAYLVRTGDQCAVRCLQIFSVSAAENKLPPAANFKGPVLKYDRWAAKPMPAGKSLEVGKSFDAGAEGKSNRVYLGDWA